MIHIILIFSQCIRCTKKGFVKDERELTWFRNEVSLRTRIFIFHYFIVKLNRYYRLEDSGHIVHYQVLTNRHQKRLEVNLQHLHRNRAKIFLDLIVKFYTPCVSNYIPLSLCHKSKFSDFNQIHRKMHQYL